MAFPWAAVIGALLSGGAAYSQGAAQRKAQNEALALQQQQAGANNQAMMSHLQSQEANQRAVNGFQLQAENDYNQQLQNAIGQAENEPFNEQLQDATQEKMDTSRAAIESEGITADDSVGSNVQGNVSKSYSQASSKAAKDVGNRASSLGDLFARTSAAEQAPRNQAMDLGQVAAQLGATQQRARDQFRIGQQQINRPMPYVPQVQGTVNYDTRLADALGGGAALAGAFGGQSATQPGPKQPVDAQFTP